MPPDTRTISVDLTREERDDIERLESSAHFFRFGWPIIRRIVAAWDAAPAGTTKTPTRREPPIEGLDYPPDCDPPDDWYAPAGTTEEPDGYVLVPETFDGLLDCITRWLDHHYPAHVPLLSDADSADPGPQLVGKTRALIRRIEAAGTTTPNHHYDTLRAALERTLRYVVDAQEHIRDELQPAFEALAEGRPCPGPTGEDWTEAVKLRRLATWWHGCGTDDVIAEARAALAADPTHATPKDDPHPP